MGADEEPEVDFSRAVLDAFRKRSRAISHRGKLELSPVKEIIDGRESRVGRTDVSIEYRVDGAPVQLRVHVWGDRWVWVDARRGSKSGWVWQFTSEGRFLAQGGAHELVARTEDMLSASREPIVEVPRAMNAIWSKCLAQGPRAV